MVSYKGLKSVIAVLATAVTAASAFAEGSVMFNYQGRVKVHGEEFNGQGQFKFAILSPNGKSTLWSNDSTSEDGSEPTTGISLSVSEGVFNVLMGENGTMDTINSTVFQSKEPLKLRTWFNDGTNNFQLLTPDHNLINTNLITSETSGDDFTIYVNGQNGDDSNSGLKPNQAKKTIQAAVDIVPARVTANVTIDIADGVYPEEVLLYGISVKPGKLLQLKGDESWTPDSPGNPSVVITGADGATTGVRESVVNAVQCNGVELFGLCLENASGINLNLKNGEYDVRNCLSQSNGLNGINISTQAYVRMYSTVSKNAGTHGIGVNTNSRAILTNCEGISSAHSGLAVMDNSTAVLDSSGDYSKNEVYGVMCINYSAVGATNAYNGTITENKWYGIMAAWGGYYSNFLARNTITQNTKGSQYTFAGGVTNW